MEQEKRIRREIANSNERRRMQSINAGFQSLRTLLPHHEGEKLSKVSFSSEIKLSEMNLT
jgi:transcription factor AP-4